LARVLVVDDDPDILNLVSFRLRRKGHKVISAGSSARALEIMDEHGTPDVAVLDVTMPAPDGFELLALLRARDGAADLPAIFLSARVLPADIEAGRAMGATYLTKPFVATALLNAVERAVSPSAEVGKEGW
jgi:CheY-like chemotaxis protein